MTERSNALAAWLFDRLELPTRPPIDLEVVASRMGVEQIRDADMAEDGRLEQDGRRAVVYLRHGLSHGRRRFTLAHELAHRALIHPNAPAIAYRRAGSDDEERLCDEIAAALLMPRGWMQSLNGRPQNLSTLRVISERGQVSLSAALVRSREVNHWRKSLLRFSLDQGKWRLQGASGVPIEWHRSIRSATSTHSVLSGSPLRRDSERALPLRAGDHELTVTAQIDRLRSTATALADLDQQLSLLPHPTGTTPAESGKPLDTHILSTDRPPTLGCSNRHAGDPHLQNH